MLIRNVLVLALTLFLTGCTQVIYSRTEGSATATKDQIRDRLAAELHCKTLELIEQAKDHFDGAGKNDSGDFTISAVRENGTVKYHGKYTQQTLGTFGGSVFWTREKSVTLGGHRTHSEDSVTRSSP